MFHRGASVKQRPLRATPSILVFTPQPMGPTAEAPQPGGCAAYGCELNGNLEYGESFVNKPDVLKRPTGKKSFLAMVLNALPAKQGDFQSIAVVLKCPKPKENGVMVPKG